MSGNWLTAIDPTLAIDLQVAFTAPGTASGTMKFRALLRKTDTGAPNPTVDIELREGTSLIRVLASAVPITSTTGQVVEAEFLASEVTNWSTIRCRIVGTPA